ncbi:universal stress protein [Saccharomonospora iraqiensis]|uniref:universal stress protein n=1 Tax=Saccharomonospora iraqiensis TaxID=52698 RepID=UPI0005943724|nr:universal stress protein [Saccharomonospora iraqiensis]
MNTALVVVVIVLWAGTGLVTGLWMIRRGHDPFWMAVAVALGPLFVPSALERAERRPRRAAPLPEADAGPEPSHGPWVLVGFDGSPEAEQAVTTALRLLGPRAGLLVVAEVVSYDTTADEADGPMEAARDRLDEATARIRDAGVVARSEVLAGPPGETLRRFAVAQGMDLLVVGRRGRGRSLRWLGGVSTEVVGRSSVPVLVVGSAPADGSGAGSAVREER